MSNEVLISLEAEQAVLGCLLRDEDAISRLPKQLTAEDFSQHANREIFRAEIALQAGGNPTDIVTVADYLRDRGLLDGVGGVHYLGSLLSNTPSAANVGSWAGIVLNRSMRRRIAKKLHESLKKIISGEDLGAVTSDLIPALSAHREMALVEETRRIVKGSDLSLPPVAWQVHSFISQGDVALIFGASNSLKSFIVIDLGLCIATGTPWHDNDVARGVVVFFVPEGQRGFAKRRRAWSISRGVSLDDSLDYVSTLPADLTSPESIRDLEAELARVYQEAGSISVLVFDTVAKNFGPGDENSTKDMSLFIASAERLARPYGATVIFVHHTGHIDQGRARGAYALKAGVDLEYRVTRQEGAMAVTLENTKAKDFEAPKPMSFEARVIDLGECDEYGEPVTSLALTRTNYQPPDMRGTGMGKNQSNALRVLREMFEERRQNLVAGGLAPHGAMVSLDDWKTATGLPASRFREATQGLRERGVVRVENGHVFLIEEQK